MFAFFLIVKLMMWHKHLYVLVNCYTPKFGLASSILSLVLLVLGNVSGSFIIVNLLPLGHSSFSYNHFPHLH